MSLFAACSRVNISASPVVSTLYLTYTISNNGNQSQSHYICCATVSRCDSIRFVRMFCEHFILISAICASQVYFICDRCAQFPKIKLHLLGPPMILTPNQVFLYVLKYGRSESVEKKIILRIVWHADQFRGTKLPIMIIFNIAPKIKLHLPGLNFYRIVIDPNPSTQNKISHQL